MVLKALVVVVFIVVVLCLFTRRGTVPALCTTALGALVSTRPTAVAVVTRVPGRVGAPVGVGFGATRLGETVGAARVGTQEDPEDVEVNDCPRVWRSVRGRGCDVAAPGSDARVPPQAQGRQHAVTHTTLLLLRHHHHRLSFSFLL